MRMEPPPELLADVARWTLLSRRERTEIGRALRRLGWTYSEIRDLVPVPKGTLAGWCRDIALTDAQAAAIRERTGSARGTPRDTQRKRRAQIERIRVAARVFAQDHLHDPLFVAGTVLYWGEGAKTDRLLALTNADPAAHRLFIRWTRRFHNVSAQFVLSLHLHHGDDEHLARQWWISELQLDEPDFTKTFTKPPGTGHRKNHLPNGVCKLRMRRSTDAWYRTETWIEVIRMQLASDSTAKTC
jgi:hypothetical protein